MTALNLKSDAEGFLIGELIRDFDKMERDIHAMSVDIAAIRAVLAGNPDTIGGFSASQPVKQPERTATLIPFGRTQANSVSERSSSTTTATPKNRESGSSKPKPPKRDESGRFIAAAKEHEAGKTVTPNTADSSLSDLPGRIKDAVTDAVIGTERLDPTIQAVQEVMTPLSRGWGMIFSDDSTRKKERWYKRIWTTLRRKEISDSKATVVTHKRLKAIEEKPISDGGIGWFALLLPVLLGIAKAIFSLPMALAGSIAGALAKLLPGFLARRLPGMGLPGRNGRGGANVPIPDGGRSRGGTQTPKKRGKFGRIFDLGKDKAGKAAEFGKEKLGKFAEIGTEAAKKGGGFLAGIGKKIGRVRGLGAVGGLLALAGVVNTETDETLTRQEKNREHGANAGRASVGLAGAAAGAAIGTAIFPVVGTAIGGIVGAIAADFFAGDALSELGARFGAWITGLEWRDIPGMIRNQVGEWVNSLLISDVGRYIKSQWDAVTSGAIQMWNNAILTFTGWIDDLKKTDIAKFITESWRSIIDGVASTWNTFVKFLSDKFHIDLGKIGEKVAETAEKTMNNINKGAGNVVSAAGDGYQAAKGAVTKAVTGRDSNVDERWQKAKSEIVEAAKVAGVDAGTLANIAHFESGFNADAKPVSKDAGKNAVRQFDGTMAISSAHGYGQFIDDQWTATLNKHGAKYGVKDAGNLTTEQAGKYRSDTKLQAAMLAELSKENIEIGRAVGGKDDLANVYALHNLGESGGKKFLEALKADPNMTIGSVLSSDAINNNPSLYKSGSVSVGEAYKTMGEMMRDGESYAQEARNLQNGITTPPPVGGLIGATQAAGRKLFGKDEQLPEEVLGTRVKSSDGRTMTLAEMGATTYGELNSKGGQAFAGGHNDPATLYATSLIQNGMGENFDRVTAQNDTYHSAKSPGSDHTKGTKTDFTVKGMTGKDADLKTAEIMAKYGLQKGIDFDTINEYDAPSAKATGGHIDFKLKEEGRAKIAKIMALERLSNGSGKAATQSNNASGIAATTGATSYYDYGQPSTPVIAKSTNIPTAPVAVIPPKAPDAPAEFSPISSSRAANQSPVNVTLPEFLVGQDVRDRKIAHIATGGISG